MSLMIVVSDDRRFVFIPKNELTSEEKVLVFTFLWSG